MFLLFIGPSGAGKGTQADRLADHAGFRHISTGDVFRENLERRTPIGVVIKRYLDDGALVPEEIPSTMMRECLAKTEAGDKIALDGYPRTEHQAVMLDEMLAKLGRKIDAVIYLNVPDRRIIEERVPGRLTCRDCQRPYHETACPPKEAFCCDVCGGDLFRRNDDTPQRTRERLKVFHRETVPLVDHYRRQGSLIIIDGERPISTVHGQITQIVGALGSSALPVASDEAVAEIRELSRAHRTLSHEETAKDTLDLVLLGAPGSGKGTQAARIHDEIGIAHVATGDLFRQHLRDETELGKLAKEYMDRGDLVPDDVTQSMVRDRISQHDTRRGFVSDGFPRTRIQAEALTEILAEQQRQLAAVLFINVPDDAIMHRISGRRVCPKCQTPYHVEFKPPKSEGQCERCGGSLVQRDDDIPETIKARLSTFHRQTEPLVGYYRGEGLLIEIPGEGHPDEVTERILRAIRHISPSR